MDVDAGDEYCLALRGHDLSAEDRRVLGAFAAQAAAVLEHHQLGVAAAAGSPAAGAGQDRAGLLATVSHDLLDMSGLQAGTLPLERVQFSPLFS